MKNTPEAENKNQDIFARQNKRGKILILSLLILLVCIIMVFFSFRSPFASKDKRCIAITQIAPYASLNLIHQGITDSLIQNGFKEDEIIFENALGSIATATQIAYRLAGLEPTVLVPISTPSAQSVLAPARAHGIPVIFAAVSDPVRAKLLSSLDASQNGVTGVYDLSPLDKQVALMAQILPKLKHLGVIYNPGEMNSVVLVERLEKLCESQNIRLVRAIAPSTQDVSTAVRQLLERIDALYLPNDNTVVSALPALLKITQTAKIPVFSGDPESVEQGCLATISYNQYRLGQQVGEMILAYLKGTSLKDIRPALGDSTEIVLNLVTADDLNIHLPAHLIKSATKIIERRQTP